jgi:hypothetical protein
MSVRPITRLCVCLSTQACPKEERAGRYSTIADVELNGFTAGTVLYLMEMAVRAGAECPSMACQW